MWKSDCCPSAGSVARCAAETHCTAPQAAEAEATATASTSTSTSTSTSRRGTYPSPCSNICSKAAAFTATATAAATGAGSVSARRLRRRPTRGYPVVGRRRCSSGLFPPPFLGARRPAAPHSVAAAAPTSAAPTHHRPPPSPAPPPQIFTDLLVPILRAHFYVTDVERSSEPLRYYRKAVWARVRALAYDDMRQAQLAPVSLQEARASVATRPFGTALLRVVPKVRPPHPALGPRRRAHTAWHRLALPPPTAPS